MRVLIWSEFYWPSVGGGELLTMNLIRGLRARGVEFEVVTGRLSDDLPARDEIEGIAVHRFPFRDALGRRDLTALERIRADVTAVVRSFAPDLVHMTWIGPDGTVYLDIQRALAVPTLISLAQHLRGDVSPHSLRRRLLRRAAWVATCAEWMQESLLACMPELHQQSSIVYHAVPPLPAADPPTATARLLCLGRMVPTKGFDVALRAFPAIAARHPTARLVVAGDGPERSALEALAAELEIADRVEFLGRVHPRETAALIAASTVLLMPSLEETFGLVALETAQLARPIVATRVEGLSEVVVDGETGFLVPAGDAAALAAAASALLDDPERCARIGRQARQRVADHFSWDLHLDSYEALYRRIGHRGRGGIG